uniref:Nudix hydrolase domain-containing protein n=1 Tax=Caenorhabditis japonica TaxID=281687 RepID=A0A8R1DL49_CAEJA
MSIWNHLLCRPIMNFVHNKCRNAIYSKSPLVNRFPVPNELTKWSREWLEYSPNEFTDPNVLGKVWADPEIPDLKKTAWNRIDGKVNRVSFVCEYAVDSSLRPINPIGRTGISGRGILGRWGPNHAADPIVTRIAEDGTTLEFVAIQRRDTGEWAIPGGMVDAGEQVSQTLRREFAEEAMSGVVDIGAIDELWNNGKELYRGYVDDPRNTDNAWMETVVINFHDSTGLLKNVNLQAGDDAKALRWIPVDSGEPLYASHEHFIQLLKENFNLNNL